MDGNRPVRRKRLQASASLPAVQPGQSRVRAAASTSLLSFPQRAAVNSPVPWANRVTLKRSHQTQRAASYEHPGGAQPPSRTPPELETPAFERCPMLAQCTYSECAVFLVFWGRMSMLRQVEARHRPTISARGEMPGLRALRFAALARRCPWHAGPRPVPDRSCRRVAG